MVRAARFLLPLTCTMAAVLLAAPGLRGQGRETAASSATSATDPVEARVDAMLAKLTLDEKIDLLGGVDGFFVRAMPKIGLPRLAMADGPMGVRNQGPASAMPGGIALAATFDPLLARRIGAQIGRDARAKGIHFLLGPGVDINVSPLNGRNFEYFGEDPWLASRMAVGYIDGVQSQGVSATVKHFDVNNSEYDRHGINVIVDERTLREIYLPAFEAAVKEAHVGAVMDSYNLINGAHATENHHLNVDILKDDWGFQGVLMSDWFATYDGVAAAKAGMDLEMPSGQFMNRQTLLPAVRRGTISRALIDDKVRRILRTAVRFGWLDRDQTDDTIPRFNQQGRQAALDGAREGIVLLKNSDNLLPLDRGTLGSIAVIGPNAYPAVPVGNGSARVFPFHAVSVLEGVTDVLGASGRSVPVLYDPGLPTMVDMAQATTFSEDAAGKTAGIHAEYFDHEDLSGKPVAERVETHVSFGRTEPGGVNGGLPLILPSLPADAVAERFTGYFTPSSAGSHIVAVQSTGEDGGYFRLSIDDKVVFDQWKTSTAFLPWTTLDLGATPHKVVLEHHGRSQWLGGNLQLAIVREDTLVRPEALAVAAHADAVVLAVGFDPGSEGEASDWTFALPPGQDELIQKIVAANPHTIVAMTSGGGVDMRPWLDRVPALLQTWYAGQEGGSALADILFGQANPSGRLPVTFDRRWEDNPSYDSYREAPGSPDVTYRNGVFVGYRGYEHNGTKPLFPFGFGLSYTTFRYNNLAVTPETAGSGSGPQYTVAFDLTNMGQRVGADVAQVYVAPPADSRVPRPPKELKGFARVSLEPGQIRRVTVPLDRRSFAYYDTATKQWQVDPGAYQILVGRSSDDIVLRTTVQIGAQ